MLRHCYTQKTLRMPPRASRQQLATHVGRVIFQSRATVKAITKKLESLPGEKLKSALEKRGLKDVSVKKLERRFRPNTA